MSNNRYFGEDNKTKVTDIQGGTEQSYKCPLSMVLWSLAYIRASQGNKDIKNQRLILLTLFTVKS